MKRRLFCALLSIWMLCSSVHAEDLIRWVDFNIGAPALEKAMAWDIQTSEEEQALSWIDILALASTRCGGKTVTVKMVDAAVRELQSGKSPKQLLGTQERYFRYYQQAYQAALGGLMGNFSITVKDPETGEPIEKPRYGLKAFSPIASGYGYQHYPDFGNSRSYGFARRHLGNDLLGCLGTPIVAVEGGTVEALGWNQYGGWRVGIRSHDRKRYYYYAHLQKDHPFAEGLKQGDTVQAGDVIGFMGRTGYSRKENTNNIEVVHLHFGLQLIFDESQKECNSEIWIDVYPIVELLSQHRSSVRKNAETGRWEREYPYRDLDF